MAGSNDIILRAPPGGGAENINLFAPTPALPDAQVSLTVNDVSGVDTTIILFAPGVGDGNPTHRVGVLVGQRAVATMANPVWGQVATTSQGVLTPVATYELIIDHFTDTNGTSLSSHNAEVPLGPYQDWTGGGNVPTIQSNRARGKGITFGTYIGNPGGISVQPANNSSIIAPYWIDAVLFRRATSTGVSAGQISEGVMFEIFGAGDEGYVFGWCEADSTWYLNELTPGPIETVIASSTTNQFTGTSQTRTIRVDVQEVSGGAGLINVVCTVDGTAVITQAISSPDWYGSGYTGIYFNLSGSVDIDSWDVNGNWLPLQGAVAQTSGGRFIGLNVTQALTGLVCTARNNRCYPPSADQPLTGLVATTTSGVPKRWIGRDTFTGTNNTLISAHTADTGQSWNTVYTDGFVGLPWIQSNRITPQNSEGRTTMSMAGSTPAFEDQVVQADLRVENPFTADGTYCPIVDGVCLRVNNASGSDSTGYYFGHAPTSQGWYLYRFDTGGTNTMLVPVGNTGIADIGTPGAIHTIRLEARGNYDVHLLCYINDILVADYLDQAAPSYVTAAGEAGFYQDSVSGTHWGSLDNFLCGDLGPHENDLIGQVATTHEGILDGRTNGGSFALAGEVATTGFGTITPSISSGTDQPLTGLVITGAVGTMAPTVNVGWPGGPFPLTPNYAVQDHTSHGGFGTGVGVLPGWIWTSLQPTGASGALGTVGEQFWDLQNFTIFLDIYNRRNEFSVSQITRPRDMGGGGSTSDELDTSISVGFANLFYPNSIAVSDYNQFPYEGYFYNSIEHRGGYSSVDKDGTLHHVWPRIFTNGIDSISEYMAWDVGDLNPGSYVGRPCFIGRNAYSSTGEVPADVAPLGMYGLNWYQGIVFYTRRVPGHQPIDDNTITLNAASGTTIVLRPHLPDVSINLVGLRGQMQASSTHLGYTNTHDNLIGYQATTSAGVLTRDPTETGASVEVPLTGLAATLYPFSWARNVVINTSESYSLVARKGTRFGDFAIRDTWGPEVIERFVGRTHAGGNVVVVPSGYGDLVYVVHLSAPSSEQVQLMLSVLDASSMTILSTINTPVKSPITDKGADLLQRTGMQQERSVAEVMTTSDGRSFAQFKTNGYIVNVAWTRDTRTQPLLTAKLPPPVGVYNKWEAFEYRGDEAYHVFYDSINVSGFSDTMQVNDATNPYDMSWTQVVCTTTGDAYPNYLPYGGDRYNGFGRGKQSWQYIAWTSNAPPGGDKDPYGNTAVWVDQWAGRMPILSVAAKGSVGSVKVVVTPNAYPQGLVATTQQGGFAVIYSGPDITLRLTGRKATATGGNVGIPLVMFLIDTFTDPDGTLLSAHVGDTGHTWTPRVDVLEISGNRVHTVAPGNFDTQYASAQAPKRDYVVKMGSVSSNASGTHLGLQPELAIGSRFDDAMNNGYVLGTNWTEGKLYLKKNNTYGETNIMASAAGSASSLELEVNGLNPTRITARVNGLLWVIIDDYGHQFTDPGRVIVWFDGFSADVGSMDNLNAWYYDPSVCIPDGIRIFTSQGQLVVAGGTTGLVATATGGLLFPEVGSVTVALTGLSTGYIPSENFVLFPPDVTDTTIVLWPGKRTAQGVLTPSITSGINQPLTGLQLNTAQGTLTPSMTGAISWGLIGIRITATPGVVALLNRELSGMYVVIYRGDMYLVVDGHPALTGLLLTTSSHAMAVYIDKAFTGASMTSAAGVLGQAEAVQEFGGTATTGAGFLTPSTSVSVALTGQGASATGGALSPMTAVGATLVGQAATAGSGTLVPVLTLGLAGAAAVASPGTFVPLITVTPLGRAAVTAQGTLTILTNIFLTGRSGMCIPGTIGSTHGCTLFPQGVAAKGYVGDVTQGMQHDTGKNDLFFTNKPTDKPLETPTEEDEFVRVLN